VCDRANIVSNIVPLANSFYTSFCKKHENLLSHTYKIKATHIAAYAIYEILKLEKCPRTLGEIARFSGVTDGEIWAVERLVNPRQVTRLSSYVARYCCSLEIPYTHITEIGELVDVIGSSCGLRTNNLIAAVIYMYANEKKIVTTLDKIVSVCGAHKNSVLKFVRKMDEKYVKNITHIFKNV
jgi:transcription initiation factor TFIIIB Brf1 subunit/transcription initiation factor TFIIB